MRKMLCLLLILAMLLCAAALAGGPWTGDPTRIWSAVCFGSYGGDVIEWRVLDYNWQSNCALLISEYGLDARPWHGSKPYPSWENSDIRRWLNSRFFNKAFTAEKAQYLDMVDRQTIATGYAIRNVIALLLYNY